jgi:hypothetical protein
MIENKTEHTQIKTYREQLSDKYIIAIIDAN